MRRLVSLVVLSGVPAMLSGCVLVESVQDMGRQTQRVFTFRPADYRDLTEEETDDWTEDVGREGRGNQPMQKTEEPDWMRNLLSSEKARSIERNVGIE